MKKIVLYLWQLPQHLLGLLLICLLDARRKLKRFDDGLAVTYWKFDRKGWFSRRFSGVSLGIYILLHENDDEPTVRHEWGHSIQSLRWGPLYLLAVGVPSAVFNNLWDRLAHKNWASVQRIKWYYSRYPEKQADKLGGVARPWDSRG